MESKNFLSNLLALELPLELVLPLLLFLGLLLLLLSKLLCILSNFLHLSGVILLRRRCVDLYLSRLRLLLRP